MNRCFLVGGVRMKWHLAIVVMALAALGVVSAPALAGQGNDVPSGPHYNLNLIGVKNAKNVDFDGGDGHRIFVGLGSKDGDASRTRILLTEGEYAVLDANGTDGEAAFQLPNPDPENDGVTVYSVYLRVLGKPDGRIRMATAATDPLTGEEVVSDLQVVEVRDSPAHGNNKFDNVSAELLYIYAYVAVGVDAGGNYIYEYMRVPLFSSLLQDYLWIYDNNGAKLVQLRFYEVPTTVPDPADVQP
jgi:hypothetical protein